MEKVIIFFLLGELMYILPLVKASTGTGSSRSSSAYYSECQKTEMEGIKSHTKSKRLPESSSSATVNDKQGQGRNKRHTRIINSYSSMNHNV